MIRLAQDRVLNDKRNVRRIFTDRRKQRSRMLALAIAGASAIGGFLIYETQRRGEDVSIIAEEGLEEILSIEPASGE